MKVKHTKGQWMANPTRYGWYIHATGIHIASVRSTLIGVPDEKEEAGANANIMAAAPEMFSILCELRRQTESRHGTTIKNGSPAHIAILALLSRIEGSKGKEVA